MAAGDPEPRATTERFSVTIEPLLISVSDAVRVLGLSKSSIGALALKGTIPSLRVGSRVLLPVKPLEEWIEAHLAEDAERFATSWSRLRGYTRSAHVANAGRRIATRRRPR